MVLADLGRKITSALQSLSKATVINEEVSDLSKVNSAPGAPPFTPIFFLFVGFKFHAKRNMCCLAGS